MTNPTPDTATPDVNNTEVPPPPMGAMIGTLIGALVIVGALVGGYYIAGQEDRTGTSASETAYTGPVQLPSPEKSVQDDGMSVGRFDREMMSAWLQSLDLPPVSAPEIPAIEWQACLTFHDAMKALDTNKGGEDYGFVGMFFHFYNLFNEARGCYLKAHELAPDDHRWVHYLGYVEENLGNFKKAEEWWKQDLELNPTFAATYMQLGHLFAQEAREDEAFEMYTTSRQYDPGNPFPCTELADIEIKRKNYYRAEELCKEALEFRADDKRAFSLLAMVYGRTDRPAEADKAIFQAGEGVEYSDPVPDDLVMDLRRKTNALAYWELLAEVQFKGKRFDLLRGTLEEIAGRDPRVNWRLQLANTLVELKEWEQAESEAQFVRRKEPDNYRALEVLGRIDFWQNRFPEAIQHFDAGVKLNPRATTCWEMKLRAHGQLRQFEEGIAASNELIKLDSNNWRAQRYRGKLFYSLGETLYENYGKIKKKTPDDKQEYQPELTKAMLAFRESFVALDIAKELNPVNKDIHNEFHTVQNTIGYYMNQHPEFKPENQKGGIPHDHDGDGIPDHAPNEHPKASVPHDHDGDGVPDHAPGEHK